MSDLVNDGLVEILGRRIKITPSARQIARVIASRFDTYFTQSNKRHTQAA
jgi:coproporphyrinogen III oxidase-like Fe-S oxidoreductase